jgi:Gpi18-like mannosyltransferase
MLRASLGIRWAWLREARQGGSSICPRPRLRLLTATGTDDPLIVAASAARIRKFGRRLTFLLSVFVRSRTAFLALMVTIAVVKLLLSAFAPVSAGLKDIVLWISNSVSIGPWVALDAQIYELWRSVTLSNASVSDWWMSPLATMPSDFRLLSLLLRLPAFLFDAIIAITLYVLVSEHASTHEARFASLLWFLNPYTVLAVEMLGVPDVAATCLTLLAVMFLWRKRIVLASMFLAAGIAIKLYPILLLPPILLYCRQRLRMRRRSELVLTSLSFLGLAGYLAWVFQFGSALVTYVLTEYTPVTQPMSSLFEYIVSTHISPTAVVLIVLYLAIWRFGKDSQLTGTMLPVFLIYYAFSAPYPQYYVWALPFLILDVVLLKRRHLTLLTGLYTFVIGYWFLSSAGFLTASGYSLLFIPLAASNLPWYSQAIQSFLQSTVNSALLMPLLYPLLAAVTFIYALEIIRYWFSTESSESSPYT